MNELPNTLSSFLVVLMVPFVRRVIFFRPKWDISPKKMPSRIQFFDILRGIAILAVIGIHVVDFYRLELFTETTGLLFLNAFLRFAIPLFLIASGMLLNPRDLHNRQGIWSFYQRKLFRIFVPYAVLTTIWSFMELGFSPLALFLHIVRGDVLVPYYFVVVLFELYVLFPLLVRLAARKWFLHVTLIISVCAAALRIRYAAGVPLPLEYLFFFAYGISLRPLLFSPEKTDARSILVWLGVAAVYFTVFFALPDYYYNAVYFWGAAAFWILYTWQQYIPDVFKNSFAYVGRLSLWIFLLHYQILFWIGERTLPFVRSIPIGVGVIFLAGITIMATALVATGIREIINIVQHRLLRVG